MGEFVHPMLANLSAVAHLARREGISLTKRAKKLAIVIIHALEEIYLRKSYSLPLPFIQRFDFIHAQEKVKMPLVMDTPPGTHCQHNEGWMSTIYVFIFKDSMT